MYTRAQAPVETQDLFKDMPIYDISDPRPGSTESSSTSTREPVAQNRKGGWLSAFLSRLFFVTLLILVVGWGCYALFMFLLTSLGAMLSFGRVHLFLRLQSRSWLSIKRSVVCVMALLTALFSPAFGIMIACTYFLMYDKNGIEEIVPSSFQDQFKEFFPGR